MLRHFNGSEMELIADFSLLSKAKQIRRNDANGRSHTTALATFHLKVQTIHCTTLVAL